MCCWGEAAPDEYPKDQFRRCPWLLRPRRVVPWDDFSLRPGASLPQLPTSLVHKVYFCLPKCEFDLSCACGLCLVSNEFWISLILCSSTVFKPWWGMPPSFTAATATVEQRWSARLSSANLSVLRVSCWQVPGDSCEKVVAKSGSAGLLLISWSAKLSLGHSLTGRSPELRVTCVPVLCCAGCGNSL